jgi:DNA modification methylase
MISKVLNMDCLAGMKLIPDATVDAIITSPPYWQCRDYGYDGQWGLEPTFNEYLQHLWGLMDEIYRVLKPEGTVWVNLGDTYSSSGESGGNPDKFPEKLSIKKPKQSIKNKCLLLLPHRFAIGCIDRGWIVRNDIIWAKRNGMPESVTDRFSKKHEYFFFMVKSEKYYFDLAAVKDKTITKDNLNRDRDTTKLNNIPGRSRMAGLKENNYDSKNPGTCSDFWDIPTKPNSKSHYATYNDALITKPILAGCPENGTILDPFAGTCTTGLAALRANRNFIGIEASKEYYDAAMKNIDNYNSQTVLNFSPEK